MRERSNRSFPHSMRRIAGGAGLAVSLAIAPAARTQADDNQVTANADAGRYERARALFVEGTSAYQRGEYIAARELFARAHDLEPGASTLRALGLCDYSLKNYVAAREELRAALAETRSNKALSRGQRRVATELLAQIEPLVGQLVLDVTPHEAMLELDRAPATGREFGLNAGEHVLTASAPGHRSQTLYVTIEGGHEQRVSIELPSNPSAGTEASAPSRREARAPAAAVSTRAANLGPEEAAERERGGAIVRGIIGLSVGAAGVWAGVVSGYYSANITSRERSRCTDGHCPLDSKGTLSDANALANVSNVSFVLGALGLGYGLYELLTLPEAQASKPAARSGTRIELTGTGLLLHGQL